MSARGWPHHLLRYDIVSSMFYKRRKKRQMSQHIDSTSTTVGKYFQYKYPRKKFNNICKIIWIGELFDNWTFFMILESHRNVYSLRILDCFQFSYPCCFSFVLVQAYYKATHSKWISRVRRIYVSSPAFENRNGIKLEKQTFEEMSFVSSLWIIHNFLRVSQIQNLGRSNSI